MSSSYDETLFTRAPWSFALSQRFRHISSRFYGTFTTAIQMFSTNRLFPAVPRPLAYIILFFYLMLIFFLGVIVGSQVWLQVSVRRSEDFDLYDMIRYRRGIVNEMGGYKDFFKFAFLISNLVVAYMIFVENLGAGYLNFQIALLMSFLLIEFYWPSRTRR